MPGLPRRDEMMRLPLGPRVSRGSPVFAAFLGAALTAQAIWFALGRTDAWIRAGGVIVLMAFAAVVTRIFGRRLQPPRGWLVVDADGLHRIDRGRKVTLVAWGEPFGITVLSSADRARLLLALTTPKTTRYLSARVRDAEDAAAAPALIDRATTAAASDLRDGDELALHAADAERLVHVLERLAPDAVDSIYMSDVAGEPIVLQAGELRIGGRRIDFSLPFEWRTSIFQERGPHTATVCQATWVRQAEVEVVLVAPMAADGGWTHDADAAIRAAGEGALVRRAITRDLRLLRAGAGDAPSREMRHAIDRVFVLPVRRALDRAPRAARVAGPQRAKASSHPS
jgi:hypothetical protein